MRLDYKPVDEEMMIMQEFFMYLKCKFDDGILVLFLKASARKA